MILILIGTGSIKLEGLPVSPPQEALIPIWAGVDSPIRS
jgi:hypothetical protein